jgi:hypothetical protein
MYEVQLAEHLRESLAEVVLLRISQEGGEVNREELEEIAGGPQAGLEAVHVLQGFSLSAVNDSITGEVTLTDLGRRVAARIQSSMVSGSRRADAVQRAILSWLKDHEGEPATVLAFVGNDEAVAWGVPFTEREVNEATEFLIQREYIRAFSTDQLGGIRPRITPDGRAALRSGLPISEYGGSSNHTTYDNHSNVTIGPQAQIAAFQAGGHGNVQIAEQYIGADLQADLRGRLAELTTLARDLGDESGAEEVRQTLAEMSDVIDHGETKPSVLRGMAQKALLAGVTAVGTSGGQALMQGLAHLVRMLGG